MPQISIRTADTINQVADVRLKKVNYAIIKVYLSGRNFQCDHSRANDYYAESIANNKFTARKCAGFLTNCTGEAATMGGDPGNIDKGFKGVFYLSTNHKHPFGRG